MTISGDEKLLILVDRIYESVDRPELWQQTIHAIAELIGGMPLLWVGDDLNRNVSEKPVIQRAPSSFKSRFFRTWVQGCHSTLFLSRSDLRQLAEYEREFGELIVRFFKIILLSILGSPNNAGARESMILLMTRRFLSGFAHAEDEPDLPSPNGARYRTLAALWESGHIFTPEALRVMRLLVPHLDRAVRLQVRMTSADLRADLLSGTLDALTLGVLLINAAGLPVCVNRRAYEITDRSNALRLGGSGLVAANRSDDQLLRQLISDASSAGSQGVLAISRGDELRPLLLFAIPLKSGAKRDAPTDAPCCAIFISDPDRTDSPSVEALRRAFGLTYREAQTAIAVAHGHGLKAAAKSMGVALTTARSQLQQTFAKTGTRQQAELAALVHRTLAQLRYDRPAADPRRLPQSPRQ